MTIKKYVKTYVVILTIYLIFRNINGYFEEIDKSKYLTLVPTNESKKKVKKYEELWSKVRDLVKSITKISDDNSDDALHTNKTIKIPKMAIAFRTVFDENNKHIQR